MKLEDLSAGRDRILSFYKKTEEDIAADLEILKEWMKKQPHIPYDLIQDSFLEICLTKNKFSIEKTKNKIENYCTLKGRFEYLYYDEITKPSQEHTFYLPMPMLTSEGERILVSKIKNEGQFDLRRDITASLSMMEFLSRYDFNDGIIFILDYSNATTSLLTQVRINLTADSSALVQEGFSARIKELHLVNKAATIFNKVLKPLLPQRIMSRFQFHNDYESLRNAVPTKYLLADFGGELKSYDEYLAPWDDIFQEHRDDLKRYINTKAREDLRLFPITEEMQGTFKKLNLD